MTKTISDLKSGETFQIKALVLSATERRTKNDSPFVQMQIGDKTGELNVMFWSTNIDDLPLGKNIVGKVIAVSGVAGDYQGVVQASLNSYDITITDDNPAYYQAGYPDTEKVKHADDILKQVFDYLHEHNTDYLQLVMSILFNDKPNDIQYHTGQKVSFEDQPAAERIHHAFKGGLKYHTARMLEQAIQLKKVYPVLNAPLLYTAILLHDAGKMLEYTSVEPTETTVDGALLGHIMIVDGWVVEYITKHNYNLNDDQWRLLRHTILAHHGRLEWGSPVVAITPEAMIINEIDMTDAKIMQFETAYEQTAHGELSHDKFFGLNNKRVYHA